MWQRTRDVTINDLIKWSCYPFYLWAHTYMGRIHDTNMSQIVTCTIVFDIFYIRSSIWVGGKHYFPRQITALCVTLRAIVTLRHFLIWMGTARQTTTRLYICALDWHTLFCLWTGQNDSRLGGHIVNTKVANIYIVLVCLSMLSIKVWKETCRFLNLVKYHNMV